MRKSEGNNLKKKMLLGMLMVLIPVMLVITVLFLNTRRAMKNEYMNIAKMRVGDIVNSIDQKLKDIYGVSDNFAANNQLAEYIDKDYSDVGPIFKRLDTLNIYDRIFKAYDILKEREKISAIYTYHGELFNFLDPNNDTQEVVRELKAMQIENPDNLMKFYWYPLRENFLHSMQQDNVRRQKAVLGVRRIYSTLKGAYICVHIFTIPEQEIYEIYESTAKSIQGELYIMTDNGELVSSTDENLVKEGRIPASLQKTVLNRTENSFEVNYEGNQSLVCVQQSEVNSWLTVMVVPVKNITSGMDKLYYRIFAVMLVCVSACFLMVVYLYKSFMNPIGVLSKSMREVYDGNLNAYVNVKSKNEVGKMMMYYNSMLERINTHIIEELRLDRRKKELELEVLMSQVNPHFLYNTLENIVWKSTEAGYPNIGRIAASLGRMYRLSLSGGQVIVQMEHEIEHLMAYVKIQKCRYNDNFEFDLRTDMKIMHELYSLKIILQPIVENSFLYGMEGLERPITIRLQIREKGDIVEIRVVDNGRGMDKERLEEIRRQIREGRNCQDDEKNRRSTGIGLHSIEARIALYFGIEHAVKIYSKQDMGTATIVCIPKITKKDMDKDSNLNLK